MIVMPEDKAIVAMLPLEDAGLLLLALCSEDGAAPELPPMANMAYAVIKGRSDRMSRKKSAAGKQGGAPRGNKNAKKQAETTETSGSEEKQPEQAKQATVPLRTEPHRTIPNRTVPEDTENEDGVPAPEAGHCDQPPSDAAQIKSLVFGYTADHELRTALSDWVTMRRKSRTPLTPRAVQLALSKLRSLSADAKEQIAIVNETVMRGWRVFYPLCGEARAGPPSKGKTVSAQRFEQRNYTGSELNELAMQLEEEAT